MKKLILIALVIFAMKGMAQTTVTEVLTGDLVTLKDASGFSQKKVSILNFENIIGNTTPITTGTETKTVSGNYSFKVNTNKYILTAASATGNTVRTIAGTYTGTTTGNATDLFSGTYNGKIVGAAIDSMSSTFTQVITDAYSLKANTSITGTLGITGLLSPAAAINNSAGLVGAPAYSFTGQTDMGLYKITSVQLGTAVSGALVGGWNASGLFTSNITEQVTGAGIIFTKQIFQSKTSTAFTGNSTVGADTLIKGILTITSGTDTLTLPTGTALTTTTGLAAGASFDIVVLNIQGGSGEAILVVNTGIVAGSAITGGTTLTVANSATTGSATFRFTCLAANTWKISRID